MLLSLLLAAITNPTASPVHLRCEFDANGPGATQISVDEPNSFVVVSRSPAYIAKYVAAFTPSELSFSDGTASYVIDRRTLMIRAWIDPAKVSQGKCAIESIPNRAF